LSDYNLGAIGPDEMRRLKQAIAEFESSSSPMAHPDAREDMDMIQPLVQAVQMIAEKVDEVDQKLDATSQKLDSLYDHYFNELIGGITGLYENNERQSSIDGLKGKYGEMFAPHMGLISKLMGSEDGIFDKIHDHMKSHYDDEGFDPDDFVDSIMQELQGLREAAGPGKAVSVQIEGGGEEPEGGIDEDEVKREVLAMAKRRR